MSDSFSYSTTYILDKPHFSETYDASKVIDDPKKRYAKPFVLALAGLFVLYFTELSAYIAWFIIALSGVELLSIRFHKPWWLARQMISKAANGELTLTIDEEGVSSQSFYVDSKILWQDINRIEKTSQGWLLHTAVGRSYLSNQCLSEEAQAFVQAKAKLKT
jgi:hypothetical protein